MSFKFDGVKKVITVSHDWNGRVRMFLYINYFDESRFQWNRGGGVFSTTANSYELL